MNPSALTGSAAVLRRPQVPSAAILAAVYLLSVLLHLWALQGASLFPHISSDEVQYALTADNLRLGKGYTLRGEFNSSVRPVYPLLLALASSLWPDPRVAMLAMGSLVMCLAVFPAFFLARHLGVSPRPAYLLAAATAFLPHTFYAATYLPESVQYPMFLTAFYASLRWLDSPRFSNDLMLGTCLGTLMLVKIQATHLIIAFLVTVVFVCLRSRKTRPREASALVRHGALVLAVVIASEIGWYVFKRLHGGNMLGSYAVAMKRGLEYWSPRLVIYYLADFLLAPGLVTAVPLSWWLWRNRNLNRAVFVAATLLVQVSLVSLLDGGLTGWLRERLFIYSLPITAIVAVMGWEEVRSAPEAPRCVLAIAPAVVLVAGLMLYPFHVSSIIEVPWANALGSFNGLGFPLFSKARLALTAAVLACSASCLLLAWRSRAPLILSGFILLFNGFAFAASSRGLAAWSAQAVNRVAPILSWISACGAKPGDRVLVAGRPGYFERRWWTAHQDGVFLDWTWRLGLDEALEWQIETLGRYDVRMIPSAEDLVETAHPTDFFLTTAAFNELEPRGFRYPFYLYRVARRLVQAPVPRYVTYIPADRFYTLAGRKAPSGLITGTGSSENGYLVYGPYLAAPAGSYRVAFRITADGSMPVTLEVAGEQDRVLARSSTSVAELCAITFVTNGREKLQYRAAGESRAGFQFAGVDLEYLGNRPAGGPIRAVFSAVVPAELARIRRFSRASCFIDLINGAPPAPTIQVDRRDGIRMVGWAANVEAGTVGDRVIVELTSPGSRYFAVAERNERPDVAAAFSRPRLVKSGFALAAGSDAVLPGSYEIRIVQVSPAGGSECDLKRYLDVR